MKQVKRKARKHVRKPLPCFVVLQAFENWKEILEVWEKYKKP